MIFFSFDFDDKFDLKEDIKRLAPIYNRYENRTTIFSRIKSSIMKIPRMIGMKAQFQGVDNFVVFPQFKHIPDIESLFTPIPPTIRNESQRAVQRMVKKFANKYECIWILVSETKHQATQLFAEMYKDQKQNNIHQNLQNMLSPQQFFKTQLFTRQGLHVKVMIDNYTYEKYVSKSLKKLQDDPKILQLYIEDKDGQCTAITSKKVKKVANFVQLIDTQVREDIIRYRKDQPTYNFINATSTPQLFSRRSVIKHCISTKTLKDYNDNNQNFYNLLRKQNDKIRQKGLRQIRARANQMYFERKINQINQRHKRSEAIICQFQKVFNSVINDHYPIEKQLDQRKKQIFNYIFGQYTLQSPIYELVNNTLRSAVTYDKVKPISTYVKYLYDGIRYYFTTKYRQITYTTVYRGARISFVEQRSFKDGKYAWNLGFMSTSKSQKIAEGFLGNMSTKLQKEEKVLIVIEIPKNTVTLQYLWKQQGFFGFDKTPDLKSLVPVQQQEVLFNPLNLFKITKWDTTNKILKLQYSPHIQMLQKRKNGLPLTLQQQQLIRTITRLRDNNYDRGQQLLEQGDPGSAVKYYDQSSESGSNLSFSQKTNYIKGLLQIGNIEKMESFLNDTLQEEKSAQAQLGQSSFQTLNKQRLAETLQSLILLQEFTDYETANQRSQKIILNSNNLSILMPTQQVLLLEVKAYIEFAKIKFGISDTIQSIKNSIRSLMLIDNLANVNLSSRLIQLARDTKQIQNLKFKLDMPNLKFVVHHPDIDTINIQEQKRKVLQKIQQVRKWNGIQQLQQNQSQIRNSLNLSVRSQNKDKKKQHKLSEKMIKNYFATRSQRTQQQKFELYFVLAYWQAQRIKIVVSNITQLQEINLRQKLRLCQQSFYQVKNDYKKLFECQVQAFQTLYRNLYKTSIDVKDCLENYIKLYQRYEKFVRIESQFQSQNILKAQVLYKFAQILYQYGQIVQRPKIGDKITKTQSQIRANNLIQEAQQTIQRIKLKDSRITGSKNAYTFQKNQINKTITRFFKKKTIQKQEARKLAVTQSQNNFLKCIELTSQNMQKSTNFLKMIKLVQSSKQLIEADPSVNKSYYKIKNSNQKIELMNESSNILIQNKPYIQRLKSCRSQFDEVIATIQKYKQRQILQKNINMAQLYLLMAQNQFRLGLIANSQQYLKSSDKCLKKSFKLDQNEDLQKVQKLNTQKIILGNSVHVGCLRLSAHIIAFYGAKTQKIKMIDTLRRKLTVMSQLMHQPINEADIFQSIGIIYVNLIILYKSVQFIQAVKPLQTAIQLRKSFLGYFNKPNARSYTYLTQLISDAQIFKLHINQLVSYFKEGLTIYNRLDSTTDPMVIIFKMQLQTSFFIFSLQASQACRRIIKNLNQFSNCKNKHISLQIAQQIFRCACFLSEQSQHQAIGLQWLKRVYKYTANLQKFVSSAYNFEQFDPKKVYITDLKVRILRRIVQIQKRNKGQQADKYFNKYAHQKNKLDKYKSQLKIPQQ